MTPSRRPPARGWQPERGSILVEAVFLLVLMTLPVFYLVGTLARVQAGAYAVSAAAREAGRAFVTAEQDTAAPARGSLAAGLVFSAHGFGEDQEAVAYRCSTDPCLTPGSTVQVDTTVRVELPLIPDFMDGLVPTTIVLSSSHLEPVDEFREP